MVTTFCSWHQLYPSITCSRDKVLQGAGYASVLEFRIRGSRGRSGRIAASTQQPHQLVRAGDERQAVGVVELLADVLAKSVACAAEGATVCR
jgi:hypothetical protein